MFVSGNSIQVSYFNDQFLIDIYNSFILAIITSYKWLPICFLTYHLIEIVPFDPSKWHYFLIYPMTFVGQLLTESFNFFYLSDDVWCTF